MVGERVEHVRDGHDPAGEGDVRLPQRAGIARAVPALVVGQRDLLGEPQERGAAAGEDLGADRRVRLDRLELVRGQPAGLEQDGVGDPDLADVVQRRGALDQLRPGHREAQGARQQAGGAPDAPRVLLGVVVAVLGRQCQAVQHPQARRFEVMGAPLLKLLHPQEVGHAQRQLDPVHRLGDEVAGPGRQDAALDLLGAVRDEREDGHAADRGRPLEHLEPVHLAQVKVQQQQGGTALAAQSRDRGRVRGDLDVRVARVLETSPQEREIRLLAVDGQDGQAGEVWR